MGELLPVCHIQNGRLRGVLSVDAKGLRTVAQLLNRISTRHGLSGGFLLYRGACVGAERQLKYLIPDLQKIGAPRFSVCTECAAGDKHDGFSVFVKLVTGKTEQVHFPAASTVPDLKLAIMAKTGILYHQIRVVFLGKQLEDCRTLADYNMVSGFSTVIAELRLRGGGVCTDRLRVGKFVDVENMSAFKTAEVVVDDPDTLIPKWEHVWYGLNIRGKCLNRRCEAFGSLVLCHKKFTVFNILETSVYCPACWKRFKAATCAFVGCEWMYEGRKKNGTTSVDVMSGWNVTKRDECQWFDEDSEGEGNMAYGSWNMAEWSSLIITVRNLVGQYASYDSRGEMPDNLTCCSICFRRLVATTGHTALCGHAAHPECVSQLEGAGYTTCPTCRNPMAAVHPGVARGLKRPGCTTPSMGIRRPTVKKTTVSQ